jgi:hypothetical protein
MRMKCLGLGLLAALILAAGAGCKKSASEAAGEQQKPEIVNRKSEIVNQKATLARVHWLGKDRIAAQTNASRFLGLWNMPEAARLEKQTLDKLALALVGATPATVSNEVMVSSNQLPVISNQSPVTSHQSPVTNPPSPITNYSAVVASHPAAAGVRPLLDDLVRQEWYLEIQQTGDQPGELALAVRLDEPRATLWTSNLVAVLGAMTNVEALATQGESHAWRLPESSDTQLATRNSQLATRNSRLDLARAGDWTLLGLSGEHNPCLEDFAARIQRGQTPVAALETGSAFQADPITRKVGPVPGNSAAANHWLEADLDLRRLSGALGLGWNLPEGWPRLAAVWTGTGEFVRTTGELTFAKPLDLQPEPWNLPTNLIREPLVSFTAVRGLHHWLASRKWLQHLQVEPAPDQFCVWSATLMPAFTFAATPMTNAAALLQKIGPQVEAELNPWITNNVLGELEYSKEPLVLTWSKIPMFIPTLEATNTPGGSFLLGRVGAEPPGKGNPAPPALFAQLTRPNLVYYDWENTQAKLGHWVYHGQTARLALVLPQMPPESAAFAFLLAVAPKLDKPAGTEVVEDGPASLSFVRNSQLGFTGVELHWLADWLESPAFPRGFHSLLAPKPKRPLRRPPGGKAVPPLSAPGQTKK